MTRCVRYLIFKEDEQDKRHPRHVNKFNASGMCVSSPSWNTSYTYVGKVPATLFTQVVEHISSLCPPSIHFPKNQFRGTSLYNLNRNKEKTNSLQICLRGECEYEFLRHKIELIVLSKFNDNNKNQSKASTEVQKTKRIKIYLSANYFWIELVIPA